MVLDEFRIKHALPGMLLQMLCLVFAFWEDAGESCRGEALLFVGFVFFRFGLSENVAVSRLFIKTARNVSYAFNDVRKRDNAAGRVRRVLVNTHFDVCE